MSKHGDKPTTKFALPYNTEIEVLDKMLTDMKNTGNEGINIDTLWINIKEANNKNKSYTLNLAKFLNLVDTDGKKVWLTNIGNSIRYVSGDKKNAVLAKNLPSTYLTMFKWINLTKDGEMFANDLKVQYINNYESPSSPVILDRAMATFLNYCQYIGLVKYIGKGRGAKAVITTFGRNILNMPADEIKPEQHKSTEHNEEQKETLTLPEDATYPIIIKTNDRYFPWDIKSTTDWTVIDSVIKSIREGWEKKHQKQKEVISKEK